MARPPHVQALISALQFQQARPELLRRLSDSEWQQLLSYSDLSRLTLILGQSCRNELPQWVQARVDRNLADNNQRVIAIQRAYLEAAAALQEVGAEHLVLKGFSQWPFFLADVRLRQQSDLDLYCPPDSIYPARDALLNSGYRFGRNHNRGTDHLPLLIRPGNWVWRGNFYDPEMMPSIELHHQFWGKSYMRFGPANLDVFWTRRVKRRIGVVRFEALDTLDAFAYSALHAVRHLLYAGLNPAHIYEIAYFLHYTAENDGLWATWRDRHDVQLRALAAVVSLMSVRWFGCRLPIVVSEEIHQLPALVPQWLTKFEDSTIVNLFEFNKDALWLHLGLAGAVRERFSILVHRLFPIWLPPLNSRWIQESDDRGERATRSRIKKYTTYLNWFAERIIRHLRVLPATLWGGVRLWAR